MTENELKAEALIIGMKLKTLDWYNWTGTKAHAYCISQAKEMKVMDIYLDYVAYTAMDFVIN